MLVIASRELREGGHTFLFNDRGAVACHKCDLCIIATETVKFHFFRIGTISRLVQIKGRNFD